MGMRYHSVAVKKDGTCIAIGLNSFGERNVSAWNNIVQVEAGYGFTVGLKSDGTCVATGDNTYGVCNVSGWTGIKQIACDYYNAYGLKSDGTVIVTGKDADTIRTKTSGWTNVRQISGLAGMAGLVALKSDGTVVNSGNYATSGWTNISKVVGLVSVIAGIKADGSVACTTTSYAGQNLNTWTNIKDISAGDGTVVGLKADGTCIAYGRSTENQCDVTGWTNIVQIVSNYYSTIALKADGSCVGTGNSTYTDWQVSGWTNIASLFESQEFVSFDKTGLLVSNQAIDCTAMTSVDGFTLSGTQSSGTNRRVIFSTNTAVVLGSRTFPITTNAVAADTVTIGGVTFTAIASGAAGNQFNVGATIAATATNLATTLNANATINAIYTATADASGAVTLTEKVAKGNTPAAATKTGTIVIGAGTSVTSVPKWYKLTIANGVATLSAVATQTPTMTSVLSEGNTVDELATITSIAAFVGKLVYPAAALFAPYEATVFPTLKLGIKGHSNQDVYAKVEYSPEFTLSSEDVEIINTSAAVTLSGSATGIVEISLKQSGAWSAWMPMSSSKRQKASAVKYKATLSVTTIGGVDSASVGAVAVQYRSNNAAVSGGFAEIITDTETFGENMHFARVTVKHKPLKDATIKAYASMRNAPKILPRTLLGTGDGTRKTFTTGVANLDPESIKVYWGASPCYDYDYNTSTGEISCTAPDGVAVLAECEYDWEPENWQPMTQSDRLNNASGLVSTGFTYALPLADPGKGISAVKVVLEKVEGTVTGDSLGIANGKTQLYVLDHAAKIDTISVRSKVGDTPVPNFWSYDPASQILSVAATDQAALTINYDWVSETPVVYSLVASWSD